MSDFKGSTSCISDIHSLHKELDEVSCSICMDHPHNAVLLLCSSHDKGCRPYICDTSYRHSNCFDRLKKLKDGQTPHSVQASEMSSGMQIRSEHVENRGASEFVQEITALDESRSELFSLSDPNMNLKCPLCRTTVQGWKIVKEARQYLDLKHKSCSQESCSFNGNYRELRRHARKEHPTTRPADIDPSRERDWQQIEHQREHGDVVSAIRSAIPGAVVVGDYVIENGDALLNNIGENGELGEGRNSPWWSALFLVQMISQNSPRARRHFSQSGNMSRFWTRNRRSSGGYSRRRNSWGENLLGIQDEGRHWNLSSHDREEYVSRRPRRRRRFTQSRPDQNHR